MNGLKTKRGRWRSLWLTNIKVRFVFGSRAYQATISGLSGGKNYLPESAWVRGPGSCGAGPTGGPVRELGGPVIVSFVGINLNVDHMPKTIIPLYLCISFNGPRRNGFKIILFCCIVKVYRVVFRGWSPVPTWRLCGQALSYRGINDIRYHIKV